MYCADYKCTHHITVRADRWPDHLRLSDIEDGLVCHGLWQARRGSSAEVLAGRGDGEGPQCFSYAAASGRGWRRKG